jgi:hypothetical protein
MSSNHANSTLVNVWTLSGTTIGFIKSVTPHTLSLFETHDYVYMELNLRFTLAYNHCNETDDKY